MTTKREKKLIYENEFMKQWISKKLIGIVIIVIALMGVSGLFFKKKIPPREETPLIFVSEKKDFKIDEDAELKFKYDKTEKDLLSTIKQALDKTDYWEDIEIEIYIEGPGGQEIDFSPEISLEENGEFSVKLEKSRAPRPGVYKALIKVEDESGDLKKVKEFEQVFTWGVLAININKSIYLPDEEVFLQITVLDDLGHTLCDASLRLQILNPLNSEGITGSGATDSQSEILNLSTEDGSIQKSSECDLKNVTYTPDYFAYYQVSGIGIYQMKLTNLDNGYEIEDSFEVRESVLFDVERIGPTRIYPPATYEMTLNIKANQDFKGRIIESVPASFKITETSDKRQEIRGEEKDIIWDVDWKAGETYELKYTFDAPDISPYLYLLGPLTFQEF